MSFSNTTKTHSTSTPTEAGNVTDFRNSLYPQISSMIANANKPVYGAAQEAQFDNKLNQNTNANMNSLASSVAGRTGSLNSGAFQGGAQNMLNQRGAAQASYAMQVPMLNQQAQFQNLGSALGLATNFSGRAPVGNTTDSEQSQTPGLGNVLTSLAGAGLGMASGGMMGGFGGGGLMGMLSGGNTANAGVTGALNGSGYFGRTSGMSIPSDFLSSGGY